MSFRSRANCAARWGGLAALICIAALWLLSGFYIIQYARNSSTWSASLFVAAGVVGTEYGLPDPSWPSPEPGLHIVSRGGGTWSCRPLLLGSRLTATGSANLLHINLWVVFLAAALPTALLWRWHRRRIPRGHCPKCRYDLTGATTNLCPECGSLQPQSGDRM